MAYLQRVLFIASEISPFLETSLVSNCVRKLLEFISSKKLDIRVIVPKFGIIDNRIHRLHEVLRLSGSTISIGNIDYIMSIKVSTIPNTHLQVYFIDNPELFNHRQFIFNQEVSPDFKNNDLRMIFFCLGAILMLKKIQWEPDIVHCHDWVTSLIPKLWKQFSNLDPTFSKAKVITTLYNNTFSCHFPHLSSYATAIGISEYDAALLNPGNFHNLIQFSMNHSDLVVQGEKLDTKAFGNILDHKQIPFIPHDDQYHENYFTIYKRLIDDI